MRNNHSILIIVFPLKNFKNKKTFNLIRDFIQKRKKLEINQGNAYICRSIRDTHFLIQRF